MHMTRFGRNANHLRSRVPLSLDQIKAVAPSVFATGAHESRSERFTFIPTVNVLEGLMGEGFNVFEVCQSRTRIPGKGDFTKHMLRMRRDDGRAIVGKEVEEAILVNAHDGTSSYQLFAGVFVFVCTNGLIVPNGMASEVKVPHKGDVVRSVIEGAYSVVSDFDKVRENRETMKAIELTPREQEAFANAAIVAKYEPEEGKAAPVTPAQALQARHFEQRGRNLWDTFNVVQENLVQRGGLSTRSANGRRMRTRPVTGISQNVALNRALWTLANEMGRIKGAGVAVAA